ncbi:MAG: uroporphyrinogen decarboxylase family protein [Candidatus Humimicrobiaceae bacterium]
MSVHIENVKKAIEFKKPDYLPMETNHVPGIYNAYSTLDPESVELIPGTENFDSIWPNSYSWVTEKIGTNDKGEDIKRDQWGVITTVPKEETLVYVLKEHPLAGKTSLKGYEFPDIEDLNPWFEHFGKVIKDRYSDKFIDAFIDAGIFLTTQFLFGINEFFMMLATDLDFVVDAYEGVADYYSKMVLKFKEAGAHQITIIEDLGSNQGLVLNPDTWRKRFKPITTSVYKHIHEQGMYTGMCIDGDAKPVLDDLFDMEIDQLFIPDLSVTGVEALREKLRGKMCFKATVGMIDTLASGTPEEVEKEADVLAENFHTPNGGFVCEVVKWHRPAYPDSTVNASIKAFNKYRKNAPQY